MAWGGLKTCFTETVVNWFKENILPMFTLEYWQKLGEQIGEGIKQGFESVINTIIKGLNGAFKGLVDLYNNTIGSFGEGFWSVVDPGRENKGKIAFTPIPDVQFKTGGLADFTGPAWLDGTKSRPEYVLNAAQTERFFSLVDVLEGIDTNNTSVGASGGDNHFEIEINVDKLENDYDVEQLADKIRRMMYDDASYRNVKAIGLMR
jgi:hypothetical protein